MNTKCIMLISPKQIINLNTIISSVIIDNNTKYICIIIAIPCNTHLCMGPIMILGCVKYDQKRIKYRSLRCVLMHIYALSIVLSTRIMIYYMMTEPCAFYYDLISKSSV